MNKKYNISFDQSQVEDVFKYCRSMNGDGLHIINEVFKRLGSSLNQVLALLPDECVKSTIFKGDIVRLLDCPDGTLYLVKKTRVCKGELQFFVTPATICDLPYSGRRFGFWVLDYWCTKVNN